MKTDKEFAIDLLGWLERYVLYATILEHLLKQSGPFSGTDGISPNECRVHTSADPRHSVSSLDALQTHSNEGQDGPRWH